MRDVVVDNIHEREQSNVKFKKIEKKSITLAPLNGKVPKSGSQNLQKEVIFRPIAQVTTYKTKRKKKGKKKTGRGEERTGRERRRKIRRGKPIKSPAENCV